MWARDCLEFQLIILHAELTLYERLVEISMRIFTRETDTRSAGTNQLKYGDLQLHNSHEKHKIRYLMGLRVRIYRGLKKHTHVQIN